MVFPMELMKRLPSSSQASQYQFPTHRGWLGPVALATHSWGILVLSPSLGARETPPQSPANLRMSSIYTWLWECVTHGSSAPHSWYVHLKVQPLTKGEGNCAQLPPRSQKPKVTQSGLRTQHTEATHMACVLVMGVGGRLSLQKDQRILCGMAV